MDLVVVWLVLIDLVIVLALLGIGAEHLGESHFLMELLELEPQPWLFQLVVVSWLFHKMLGLPFTQAQKAWVFSWLCTNPGILPFPTAGKSWELDETH